MQIQLKASEHLLGLLHPSKTTHCKVIHVSPILQMEEIETLKGEMICWRVEENPACTDWVARAPMAREDDGGEIKGSLPPPTTTQVPPLPRAWVAARQRGQGQGEVGVWEKAEVRRPRREAGNSVQGELGHGADLSLYSQRPSILGQVASPLSGPQVSPPVKQAGGVRGAGLSEI